MLSDISAYPARLALASLKLASLKLASLKLASVTRSSKNSLILAYPARLELATFGVGGRHSIQLSYGYIILK